jgi:predicted PurR-regulated permease PerM
MAEPSQERDRRRLERRAAPTLAELTVPELRRMLVTTALLVIVLALFLWMVRTVIIATIVGIIVATFMRPLYAWLLRRWHYAATAAATTLLLLLVPAVALTIYAYGQIADVAGYIDAHQAEIATQIDVALRRLPFLGTANTYAGVRHWVVVASNYGANIVGGVREALAGVAVAATIFVFTAFYLLIDARTISAYVWAKIPAPYTELARALESNVRGVLYGAIYSTILTQALKSVIILVMNVAFHVPLSGVLTILSFIIGFFPIVGSWSVYLPVAAWLVVFRGATGQALAMVSIGFFVNTLYISTILRPKIAAERSKVLNFYWMLVGLVTGVYTFGLVGILLGPMLIGLLKAILDTITATPQWKWSDSAGDGGGANASEAMS